jgi:hypothetical protein
MSIYTVERKQSCRGQEETGTTSTSVPQIMCSAALTKSYLSPQGGNSPCVLGNAKHHLDRVTLKLFQSWWEKGVGDDTALVETEGWVIEKQSQLTETAPCAGRKGEDMQHGSPSLSH